MNNPPRRSGGVFIGDLSGAATLREALALAPAARVELLERTDLDPDDVQARL